MTVGYTPAQPGSWLLLATPDAVLYVDGAAADAVADLWAALGSATPVQASLDILTRNGLGSTPSFALGTIVAGSLHALVRGPLVLDVTSAGGVEPVDGAGVSTWRETTLAGVTALAFGAAADHLPIGSGAVWASAFTFQPGTAPIAPADPLRAPVASAAPALTFETTLVEHTMADEPEEPELPAAIRDPQHVTAEPEVLGEHDGETVMSADVAAMRRRAKAAEPSSPPVAVRSVYLELPNDQREPLTQPVIIGRSPSVAQVSGAELPRLVSLPGRQDISRSHARFALEGDTVVVTDLHSRNGTTIALPGKPAELLRTGEPTAVLPGTVVELGGVLIVTVREA